MDFSINICWFCLELRSDLYRRDTTLPGICAACSADCLSLLNGHGSRRGFHAIPAGAAAECRICDRDSAAVARMFDNGRANICAGCVRKSRMPSDPGPGFGDWFKAAADVAGAAFSAYNVVSAFRGIRDDRLRRKEMARLIDDLIARDQTVALQEMEDLAFAFNDSEWTDFEKLLEHRRHDSHNALLLLGRARRARAAAPRKKE